MLKKVSLCTGSMLLLSRKLASAAQPVVVTSDGAPTTVGEFFSNLTNQIMPYAMQIGGFLIFLAVLMVGFEVIKNRNDGDKRKEALHSLLWLAVGAFIIGSAVVIASILWGGTIKLQ